jgi:hypothetical protein
MIINDPAVVEEITAASDAYEQALMDNDVEALDAFFWDSPHTVRLGVAETLYGFAAIAAFRVGRVGGSPKRERLRVEITTFGADFAVVNTEFRREGGALGRQSQTWVRTEAGWRVCSAHVSLLKSGADQRGP